MTTSDSQAPSLDAMPDPITDFAQPSLTDLEPSAGGRIGALGDDQASDLFGHWADAPAADDAGDDALAVPKMFR